MKTFNHAISRKLAAVLGFVLFTSISSFAALKDSCDVIVTKKGEEIAAKVLEIADSKISYKKCSNKSGPTYSISKAEVLMIKYVSGDKDVFANDEKPKPTEVAAKTEEKPKEEENKDYAKEKRHFIALNLGSSSPLGNYGETEPDANSEEGVGFAKTGANFSLEGAYYFIPNLGVGANFGAFVNAMDNDAVLKELQKAAPSSTFNGEVGGWSSGYFLVGPYFALPLKTVTLDFKAPTYLNSWYLALFRT